MLHPSPPAGPMESTAALLVFPLSSCIDLGYLRVQAIWPPGLLNLVAAIC